MLLAGAPRDVEPLQPKGLMQRTSCTRLFQPPTMSPATDTDSAPYFQVTTTWFMRSSAHFTSCSVAASNSACDGAAIERRHHTFSMPAAVTVIGMCRHAIRACSKQHIGMLTLSAGMIGLAVLLHLVNRAASRHLRRQDGFLQRHVPVPVQPAGKQAADLGLYPWVAVQQHRAALFAAVVERAQAPAGQHQSRGEALLQLPTNAEQHACRCKQGCYKCNVASR